MACVVTAAFGGVLLGAGSVAAFGWQAVDASKTVNKMILPSVFILHLLPDRQASRRYCGLIK
jgi:putative IMPACT (imprinted ancient) family translation regulator